MHRITDIYFVGGFGTVQWIAPDEYLSSRPDDIVLGEPGPTRTLQQLNEAFSADLIGLMSMKTGERVSEVLFISIDASGADIRVRTANEFNVQRIGFPGKVHTLAEVMEGLRNVVAKMKQMASLPDKSKGKKGPL